MKTKLTMRVLPRLLGVGLCCGLCLGQVPAQDKPAEARPKPEPVKPVKPTPAKVPFLGVAIGPVDEALAAQLGLPEGVGVLVRAVMPDSPAAKAGVQQHDVLHYFGDQLLVNEPQLQTLVSQAGTGAEVKLTVLRKGKSEIVTVKIGEHEPMPPPDEWRRREQEERETRFWRPFDPHMRPEGAWAPPRVDADAFTNRVRELEERMQQLKGRPEEMREAIERFQKELQEMTKRHEEEARRQEERARKAAKEAEARLRPPGEGGAGGTAYSVSTASPGSRGHTVIVQNGTARMTWSDADGSGEFVNENGSKKLTVKDRDGRVTFSGPIDTEEQRKALPADVRERLERIEKGVKVEMHPAGAPKKE